MKVMTVFGTRPEAIKMCPLITELKKRMDIETVVCLTGQHKEMLDQVMDVFGIEADYNMSVMKDKQTLSMITSAVIRGFDEILQKEKPDVVLVHGDTTTSFAAGLVSFYHQIPVGHIEAGLRTYNLQSPYPEEFNRQAADIFSEFYFVPTERAKENLLREGKSEKKRYGRFELYPKAPYLFLVFNESRLHPLDSRLLPSGRPPRIPAESHPPAKKLFRRH